MLEERYIGLESIEASTATWSGRLDEMKRQNGGPDAVFCVVAVRCTVLL